MMAGRSWRRFGMMATMVLACSVAMTHAPARAASDELTDRVAKAWETFSRWQLALESYQTRGGVEQQILALEAEKNRIVTERRAMRAQIDRFHPDRNKWNSIQHQYHDNWVALGERITVIDAQLEELRLAKSQLNEADLADAEQRGGRPRAGDRRTLVTQVQQLERETRDRFEAMRARANQSRSSSSEQAIRDTVAKLSRSRNAEVVLAPPEAFLSAYRQFLRGGRNAPSPPSKKRSRR